MRRARRILLGRDRESFAVDEPGEDVVVHLGARRHQLGARLLGRGEVLGGDIDNRERGAPGGVVEDHRLHGQQIDDPAMGGLLPERELHGDGPGAQARADRGQAALERGAYLVHLVDEGEPRHAVAVRLPPHGLRLRLHAVAGVEDRDRAVEDPERALDLDGEVDVTGGVDEADAVLDAGALARPRRPRDGGRRGGDGDAHLPLLREVVELGVAVVHLSGRADLAGEEEDPLGAGGLAGVDVRDDSDVAKKPNGSTRKHGSPHEARSSAGPVDEKIDGSRAALRSRARGRAASVVVPLRREAAPGRTPSRPSRAPCRSCGGRRQGGPETRYREAVVPSVGAAG